jgi:NAD(P)-dependent dehydrogenase (short-subunit alcohol dehydrogenase family)
MRTAVVTGAARGIARAISLRPLADGLEAWAVDSDRGETVRTTGELGAAAASMDATRLGRAARA